MIDIVKIAIAKFVRRVEPQQACAKLLWSFRPWRNRISWADDTMHLQELRGYKRNAQLSTPSSEYELKTVPVDFEGKCVAGLEGYARIRRVHIIGSKVVLASNGRVKRCQRHCQCSQEATGTPDEAAAGPAG